MTEVSENIDVKKELDELYEKAPDKMEFLMELLDTYFNDEGE